jgi:hypothetical protein
VWAGRQPQSQIFGQTLDDVQPVRRVGRFGNQLKIGDHLTDREAHRVYPYKPCK